jgi:hypothetical protein
MQVWTRLVGARSARLALSFYPALALSQRRLTVCPPWLRPRLFECEATAGFRDRARQAGKIALEAVEACVETQTVALRPAARTSTAGVAPL